MNFSLDQIEELRAYGTALSSFEEDGRTYFLIKDHELPEGCNPRIVDIILQPTEGDGYRTRVFFSEQVQNPFPRNWNTSKRLLERNWHAYSWNFDPVNMTLSQILIEHLQGLIRP